MRYQRVVWHHDDPTEPVVLFAEIDDEGWERRKVDEFRDGRLAWADESREERDTGTGLSIMPVPDLSQINADDDFDGAEISATDFEAVWAKARATVTRDIRQR
jgi:hypothetical protein